MRVRLAWGRRRAAPNEPAPSLFSMPPGSEREDESFMVDPYPYYYVYDSKEQALEQAALRNREKQGGLPPLPLQTAS